MILGLLITTCLIIICGFVESQFDGFGILLACILTIPNMILFFHLTEK